MKVNFKFLCYLIILVFIFNCESDDEIEPADFEVDITLTGDVNDFNWSLTLDSGGTQVGNNNPFNINSPFIPLILLTGELAPETTHTFTARFVDSIAVRFTNLEFSMEDPSNMSANFTIRKNNSEISRFTRSYERSLNTEFRPTEFLIVARNINDIIECEGNDCP